MLQKHFAAIIVSFLVGLSVLAGFRIEHLLHRNRSSQSVEAILRNEATAANSYALAKSVADLETLGVASCFVLRERMKTERVFYDTSSSSRCYRNVLLRSAYVVSAEIKAINGMEYGIEFQLPFRFEAVFLELFLYLCIALAVSSYIRNSENSEKLHEANLRSERLESDMKLAKAHAISDVAKQVSHDIRSPIATLTSVLQTTSGLDEASRVQIRNAVNRIRDIANGMLERGRHQKGEATHGELPLSLVSASDDPLTIELLSALVESSFSEKRLQAKDRPQIVVNFTLDSESASVFSEIQPTEFHRIISNLVNNAVEALDNGGQVKVALTARDGKALISVEDNGKGIPAELLPRVVERGGTFGKKDGNGLGLSHAKATVESWGGSLKIESEVGKGTKVTLELPLAEAPAWFPEKIEVRKHVLVADDDPGIIAAWKQRLEPLVSADKIIACTTPAEVLAWYRSNLDLVDETTFLVDYEFAGDKQTGLDVINMTGIGAQAYLVTSRWDEPEVRASCIKLGAKLLPKLMIAEFPLSIAERV